MNDSKDPSGAAKRQLTEACRKKDATLRLAWMITIGEGLLLGVIAFALVDYWLMLPVLLRSCAAAVLLLLTAFGAYRLIRLYRQPTPLKEAALDLEAQDPALGCEVSTAAEYLSGERRIVRDYEAELVEALEGKAAAELSGARVAYERKLLRPAVILFVVLLGLLIFVVAFPVALTALTRTALPFSNAHYTHLVVQPGNIEIPVGRTVVITNVFTGRLPREARIEWQSPGDASWHSASLSTGTNGGTYYHTFSAVDSDRTYRVIGNDAISDTYHIQTYVPPEIKDLSVHIDYPEYTHLTSTEQSGPEVSAPRASTVQFHVEPSVALATAKLRFSNGQPEMPLHAGTNGLWTAKLSLTNDTDYWIEVADAQGHRGGDEKPHHIHAIPDLPPKVEIQDPGQDTHAAATNKVPVQISVSDDFGVEDVKLVAHKLGSPARVISVKRGRTERGEQLASAELDLSSLDLKDYDVVAYYAEAKDNNTLDGPGIGKSPVYFVEITDLKAEPGQKPDPSQKANLLALEKQIIADTTALPPQPLADKFSELSTRQQNVRELGQVYLNTLSGAGLPEPVLKEMHSALDDMAGAKTALAAQKQQNALPPEESALAHLYQVIKQMPQLQNLPTQPPPNQTLAKTNPLAVVLEAIKERKKEQSENSDIEDALKKAQALAQAQADVNSALRQASSDKGQTQGEPEKSPAGDAADKAPTENKGQGNAQAAGASRQEQTANAQAQGQGKGQEKAQGKGQGEPQGQGQGQGKAEGKGKGQNGQGQGEGKGKGAGQGTGEPRGENTPNQPSQNLPAENPEALAQQEEQLTQQAQALAQKLQQLAGQDKRVGHNAGQNAHLGAQKIAAAREDLKQGNFGAAGVNGFKGEVALRQVIAQLERTLQQKPEAIDVAHEEAPKQFEPLISDYFKKLSHAE